MGRLIGSLAAGLGHVIRFTILVWKPLVRLVGCGLVTYAVWTFDPRVAFGVAGACLLVQSMQGKRRTE
jgi:hypothetical protein